MAEADREILHQFQSIGRGLFFGGLISSHGGNMSVRWRDSMMITRHGCMLGCIRDNDLVKMGIEDDTDRGIALASSELGVHRAIYRETPALAIVHAHLPHATALSMVEREIVPRDVEGCSLFNKVAVVGWGMKLGPGELAAEIAMALRKNVIILVHGHGSFARGEILEEAYHVTSALEQSCHLLWLLMALKAGSSSPAEHGS